MKRRLKIPSPSLTVSLLALFIALGGTAYAAVSLPRNSVGTRQLKKSAVTGRKIKNHTIGKVKLKKKTLAALQGSTGPQGPKGATGQTGAQGATGVGVNALFGDGSDGDVTISTNASLSRDMYYSNLTINPGVTLDPNGYRIFVSGTLTLNNGSAIARNGNPEGIGSTYGAGLTPETLGGAAGGDGSSTGQAGHPEANSLGGNGGAGPGPTPGGVATPPVTNVGGSVVFQSAFTALTGRSLDGTIVGGGAGGGGDGTYYGGGGGGGVVVVAARTVTLASGAATVTANGGSSTCCGGGGGGVVVVISTSPRPAGVTLNAAGGTGDVAVVGAGANGSPGFTDWLN